MISYFFSIFQMRNVRTVPNIFSLHIRQSSILLAHSSQAIRCRHGKNNVCTRVRRHFRQVISKRNRSFSFFSFSLSIKHAHTSNVYIYVQNLRLKGKNTL